MRRAFTLPEVLVACGVIGLLAGLLFPTLASVRERGRRVTCLSNLRQAGLAVALWADDHDGGYPPLRGPEGTWAQAVVPNVKSRAVLHCPTVRRQTPWGDYGLNALLAGRPLCAVREPAETLLLADSGTYASWTALIKRWVSVAPPRPHNDERPLRAYPDCPVCPQPMTAEVLDASSVTPRHGRQVMVAWADGHVSAEGMGRLLRPFREPRARGGTGDVWDP